jgi:Zn-finger nucleic acid-binding protein
MAYRRSSSPLGACPRCHHPLVEYRELPGIRACEICAGMFADNARSRAIVAALDRALLVLSLTLRATRPPTARPDHEITCPECQGPMARIAIASAACTIDACGEHGTWFDAGELDDVMRAYANQRRRGASTAPAPGPRPDPRELWGDLLDEALGGGRA